MNPRCPDCGVEMGSVDLVAGGHNTRVRTDEQRDGILGSLGANETHGLGSVMCPECGLVRLYADLDD